ncbi:MAG: hypothetical protein PHO66_01005 [Eubacteriales bacterium]|nr:hypothetical protein [Eubacteriales bacterium]
MAFELKDPQMQQYFDSLPAYIQETIAQAGPQFDSLQQLEQMAQHLLEKST